MEEKSKNKNEKSIKDKRRKHKVKRQISIFTIMLWVFLISTMITIIVNSTKKTNALEVEDKNWNISLVMYDRSSDTPNEQITEFTWNAESSSETKQLCMQINYSCTTGKGYKPGEIEISINGFGKNGSELNKNYYPRITISADEITDITKKYDFSYNYNENSNIYTFTNNSLLELNEHFEGTIQLVYSLEPKFKIRTDLEFKAKIKENTGNIDKIISMQSNICKFNYISKKKIYSLSNEINVAPRIDYTKINNLVDKYYWVSYKFVQDCEKELIYAFDNKNNVITNRHTVKVNQSVKEKFPKDCVVYDVALNKIESVENNLYYYLNTNVYYYVGYPKNKYNEGDKITNTAELWGRYEDDNNFEKLTEATSSVSLVDYNFEYNGELYKIGKQSTDSTHENSVKNGNAPLFWNIYFTTFYTDKILDVEIGDDLLYITRKNGVTEKLKENEYNFTNIEIPIFYTYNKYSGSSGDVLIGYNYEVKVRYRNSTDYILYQSGVTSNNKVSINFDSNDIVGIKVVIKDLDKTLYGGNIKVYNKVYTNDFLVNGKIYNFDYLQVYKKDENGDKVLDNEVSVNNYTTPSTLKIAEYDINTYGRYMQREYASKNITNGYFRLGTSKYGSIIKNDVKNEKYEISYNLRTDLDIEYYDVDKDCIIKQYDILPSGENLLSSKDEILDSIYTVVNPEIIKLKDGTKFDSIELNKYIRENTTIDIDYNYRNSGRTKISIICNLKEIDWSFCLENKFSGLSLLYFKLNVEIPYDSIMEYGTSYTNYTYVMWNNQEHGYQGEYKYGWIFDNGQYDTLASDIDEDGDTTEKVTYDSDTLNITHAV